MAFLDDAIRQLTQGGNGSQSLAKALQELLAGRQSDEAAPPRPAAGASVPPPAPPRQAAPEQAGDMTPEQQIFAGLNGLLKQLQEGGLDDVVKSWVGNGQNQPVHPDDLGQALGADKVGKMADKAGCPQDDLLSQLSKTLPGLIDQLTANGRMPTLAELQQRLRSQ